MGSETFDVEGTSGCRDAGIVKGEGMDDGDSYGLKSALIIASVEAEGRLDGARDDDCPMLEFRGESPGRGDLPLDGVENLLPWKLSNLTKNIDE